MTVTVERTAGMVKGTPDWQLDRMVESEAAAAWESSQEESEVSQISKFSYNSLIGAWASLETVKSEFGLMETRFANAMEKIPNTPESDKLASIFDQLSDLMLEVTKIRQHLRNEAHKAWKEGRMAG